MAAFQIHEDSPTDETTLHKQKLKKQSSVRGVLQPLNRQNRSQKRFKIFRGSTRSENVCEKTKESVQIFPSDSVVWKDENVKYDLSSVIKDVNVVSFLPKQKIGPSLRSSSIKILEHEYEEDIWQYLLSLEKRMTKVKLNYMSKQAHVNWEMRSVLIDWLVNVAEEYKLRTKTIHLSVNYLDRFLNVYSVIREKFQLVGAATMLIAGKIEEIYPPDLKEWAYLTADTFTVRQFVKIEQLILKVLNFELTPPTIVDFIEHLCAKMNMDEKTMFLAMYLSELVLLEGRDYLNHLPSKLAAASVALARYTMCKRDPWSKKLEETTGYSLNQLSPVVQKQQKTFKSSPFKNTQAIQNRYSSDKYQKVALLRPRALALDYGDDEE